MKRLVKVKGTRFYFLDIASNEFIRIPQRLYDLFDEDGELIADTPKNVDEGEILGLKNRFSKGMSPCVCGLPSSILYRNQRFSLDDFLRQHCRHLILELTEKCNLRCSYCVFSGSYLHFREHGSRSLSLDTAQKAIRDFLDRSVGEHVISFFGGEPLLELSLLQTIVEFAVEYGKSLGKKPRFALTTNGTLLTPTIVRYLFERNFYIDISLDGDKEIHDSYRKFHGRHDSVFDMIIKNMWDVAAEFPSINQLSVIATLASPMHYEKRNAFFRDLCKPFQLIGSSFLRTSVGQSETCCGSACTKEVWFVKSIEDAKEFQSLEQRFLENLIKNPEEAIQQYPLIACIMRERLSAIHYRQLRTSEDSEYYKIPCFPGYQKLFLDINGVYYPCERTERSPNYQLGTVESGFDAQKAILLMDKFRNMVDCVQCDTRYLCELCYAELHECCEGVFDRTDYERRCDVVRSSVRKNLSDYILLAESDPKILECLCTRETFEDDVLIPKQKIFENDFLQSCQK